MAGDLIKVRRATETQWETIDPVLSLGEPGWDTTNNELRFGNGIDHWTGLNPIAGGGGGGGTASSITFSPTGNIAATNVQTALAELDTEKAALIGATFAGGVIAATLATSGITGATSASRYVGATTTGSPASGTFLVGDFVIDRTGALWVCTIAGSPGTWVSIGGSGSFVTLTGTQTIAGDKTFTSPLARAAASADATLFNRALDLSLQNTTATDGNYMTVGLYDAGGTTAAGIGLQTLSHTTHTGRIVLSTRTSTAFASRLTVDEAVTVATGTPFRAPVVQNPQAGTTYTLALTDASKLVELSSGSTVTVTVPSNSSVAFPIGTEIHVARTGAGTVTVAGAVGVSVNTASSLSLTEQWAVGKLIKRATDTWLFVADEVGTGGGGGSTVLGLNTQTGTSYTLVLLDADKVVELNNAASVTVTVPLDSSVAFPIGTMIPLCQLGAGQVTISPAVGVTIRTSSSSTTRTQYAEVSLRKRATNEWVLAGDLT